LPEKIPLGDGGEWIEIRDLTGADRKWWQIRMDDMRRTKGPAVITEPDPDNPAMTKQRPNPDAEFSIGENYDLMDALAAEILTAWSFPGGMPYTAEHRSFIPLDVSEAFDQAIIEQAARLRRGGPKPTPTGDTSETSSPGDATAPQTEPMQPRSSTPTGS
jgi:hypothetical protein